MVIWVVLINAVAKLIDGRGIIFRHSIYKHLQTRLIVIDLMIPIGWSQWKLILEDRWTDKTGVATKSMVAKTFLSQVFNLEVIE